MYPWNSLRPAICWWAAIPMSGSYEAYTAAMERSYSLVEQEMETLRTELIDELRGEADRLRELGFGVKVEVQFGDPAQRIIQYVNDEGIGLVAMATHGRSGLSRLVLGSVAERVLRGASVPVLLLRPQEGAVERSVSAKLATTLGRTPKLAHCCGHRWLCLRAACRRHCQ